MELSWEDKLVNERGEKLEDFMSLEVFRKPNQMKNWKVVRLDKTGIAFLKLKCPFRLEYS